MYICIYIYVCIYVYNTSLQQFVFVTIDKPIRVSYAILTPRSHFERMSNGRTFIHVEISECVSTRSEFLYHLGYRHYRPARSSAISNMPNMPRHDVDRANAKHLWVLPAVAYNYTVPLQILLDRFEQFFSLHTVQYTDKSVIEHDVLKVSPHVVHWTVSEKINKLRLRLQTINHCEIMISYNRRGLYKTDTKQSHVAKQRSIRIEKKTGERPLTNIKQIQKRTMM